MKQTHLGETYAACLDRFHRDLHVWPSGAPDDVLLESGRRENILAAVPERLAISVAPRCVSATDGLQPEALQVTAADHAPWPPHVTRATPKGKRNTREIGEFAACRNFTEHYFEPIDFSAFHKTASTLLAGHREVARA